MNRVENHEKIKDLCNKSCENESVMNHVGNHVKINAF